MTKSGLEMIESLLEKVELLDRRFITVEQNVKELLSRANGFVPNSKPSLKSEPTIKQGPSILGTEPNATEINAMNAGAMKSATNTTKVMGKIKNKEGKSLIGVNVTVVNESGDVVKQTKTNRAGEWMSFLPSGKYKARYFLEKMINTTVGFNVNPDQTLIRVAQPKLEG